MGKRLKDLTHDNTKCMVKVNGVTLIERVLSQLDKCSLSRIVMVVGYERQKLMDYIATLNVRTPICYVENPIYDKTNNIYSLALAKEYLLKEDTLLLESDLIFDDSVLSALLDDPRETLALVDKYESWMDGTCVKLGDDDTIEAFVSGKKLVFEDIPKYYKTVNIYKFSKRFSETHYVPFLEAYSKALGNNEYYEQVLRVITMLDEPGIKAKKLDGQLWYEIDDIQDLDIASSLFASDEERVANISSREGGYWRYPHMLDFSIPTNPYFPPKRLADEMKASFETLLTQSPSGMEVNNLLAAKDLGIHAEHVLVGASTAELSQLLLGGIESNSNGVVQHSLGNNCLKNGGVAFTSQNADFSYSADDLMSFFDGKEISALVMSNPDSLSGNHIKKSDMLRLAKWCEKRDVWLVVDESYVDFVHGKDSTLITEDIINEFRHLAVVKDVSASCGVAGLRLAVLVSGDEELVSKMKAQLPPCPLNSFGEFFMQIMEKYKKDFEEGLAKFQEERARMLANLRDIPQIRVIPSEANFFMLEVKGGMGAKKLTQSLLVTHNILVKGLSDEAGGDGRQFIRVAVRDASDDDKLVIALKKAFS